MKRAPATQEGQEKTILESYITLRYGSAHAIVSVEIVKCRG